MPAMPTTCSPSLLRAGALLGASVLLLAGCGSGTDTGSSEPASDATSDGAEASPESSPTAQAQAPETNSGSPERLPLYWVVDTDQGGPRLVREFTKVRTDDALLSAAELLLTGTPVDPDYRSLWPSGDIAGVSEDGGTITVQFQDDQWQERPAGMSAADARQALQQMVYTLQGVAQGRSPVTFEVGGDSAQVLGIDTSKGVKARSPLRTLNLVSITTPESDAAVDGEALEVSGVANSFEANVVCQVLQGDEVVGATPITAEGWMGDKLFPFSGEVSLAEASPGPAQVRCATDDPTGGLEGVGQFRDDKLLTIG